MSGVLWGEKPMHQLCDSFLILIPFHYIFLCYTTHTHTHMDAVWCQQQLQFNQCHSSHICLIEASHITHTHTHPLYRQYPFFQSITASLVGGKNAESSRREYIQGRKERNCLIGKVGWSWIYISLTCLGSFSQWGRMEDHFLRKFVVHFLEHDMIQPTPPLFILPRLSPLSTPIEKGPFIGNHFL